MILVTSICALPAIANSTRYSVSQIGEVQDQKPIAIWSKSLRVLDLSEKRYTYIRSLCLV